MVILATPTDFRQATARGGNHNIMIHACSIALLCLALPQTTPQGAATQEASAKTPTRAQLAAAVAKAHRPGGPAKTKTDRYRASIEILSRVKKEDSIAIGLQITYGSAIERAKGKTMPMMVYQTNEGGKEMMRGFSHDGIWQKIGEEISSLSDHDHQTDRELVQNHLRLCKIMLRFLDPGAIIGSLRGGSSDSEGIFSAKLQTGRGRKGMLDTYLISGSLSGFPVARSKHKIADEMVWMEAWVDKKTSLLRAVRIFPLSPAGKPQWERGEDIVLDKFQSVDGVALPLQLKFYDVKNRERGTPKLTIKLQRIQLNPTLSKQDFAIPR